MFFKIQDEKGHTNKCSTFLIREVLAYCPFELLSVLDQSLGPHHFVPQQNLRVMFPTINCSSHPNSKGFSAQPTIHPKSHTPPQDLTKSEVEGSIGLSLVFTHNRETLVSFGNWQIPLVGHVSLSIQEPNKGLSPNFIKEIPLVQTSHPQIKLLGSLTT